MANEKKQRLINANLYEGNARLLGIADITLPSLEAMTDEIKGLGLAGSVDVPIMGQFGSMEVEINFQVHEEGAVTLFEPRSHQLVARGAMQVHDSGTGSFGSQPIAVFMAAIPKSYGLGKLEPGASMDSPVTMEVTALKQLINGVEVLEIDKYNMIFRVNGVDYLADVRRDMGLA